MSKKIGVILSGCGYLDGAEINEAVLTLLHLDRAGCDAVCMAPKQSQMHVVDHVSGDESADESRDVFRESARIARGKLRDIAEVQSSELDGLVMPGGFGAAKNLSTFATAGADGEAHPEVIRLLHELHEQHKPIGVLCIAPAVCALAFRGTEVSPTLTIGEDPGTAEAITATGARHEPAPVDGIVVDEANKIVSTPAFMYGNAGLANISTGIEKLVTTLLSLT